MSGVARLVKICRNYRVLSVITVISACATSGPVSTVQGDSQYEIVSTPNEFISPLDQIETARTSTLESEIQIKGRKRYTDQDWYKYASWAQSWDELEYDQRRLEQELAETGEVELSSGHSYSFDLESYCVNGGAARPVNGDELKAAPMRGPAESWLPVLLSGQGKFGVAQQQVQYLIWALLYDARFDELSDENQAVLLQFYPDAKVRFGNRRLEELGKDVIRGLLPSDITDAVNQITEYREQVLGLRDNLQALEQALAPISDRKMSIPVGWMQMSDGYLMRLTSDSYTRVRVDIYVPEEGGVFRSPQAVRRFRPSQWIALPAQGQRLAISTKTLSRQKRDHKTTCDKNREYRPKSCRKMTGQDRKKILSISDPKLFSLTRYHQISGGSRSIEDESDCSSFVTEIYRRAGFNFPYSPTSDFTCFSTFSMASVEESQPGDLILYPGHIGIMSSDGQVISATVGGKSRVSTLPKIDPRFRSAIRKMTIQDTVQSKPLGVMKWSCP